MYVGNCVGEGNVFIVSLYQRSKGLSRNMYIAEEWCWKSGQVAENEKGGGDFPGKVQVPCNISAVL